MTRTSRYFKGAKHPTAARDPFPLGLPGAPKLVLGAGDSGLSVSCLDSAAKPKNEGAPESRPQREVRILRSASRLVG